MCSKETLYAVSYYLEASSGLFGFIGALSIVIAYLLYKDLRTYYFQAVFYTSIADGLKAIIYFIPISALKISEVCYLCAITTNYMTITSTMWSLFISVVLYQAIFKSIVKAEKYTKVWFVIIFCILPLVFLLPLITGSYGLVSINCTFKENFSGNMWRIGLFYIPGWIMIFVSVYAYFTIFKRINFELIDTGTKIILRKVILYPLLIIFLFIMLSILRILEIILPTSCGLAYFSAFCLSLYASQGFWNAVIFFRTPLVRSIICKRRHNRKLNCISSEVSASSNINLLDSQNILIKESTSLQRLK
ncbi:hypothetical protein SteCoe_28161 [Stentor coeruleus]|uniref:G-protein coupled receptors family 2 profile 2 domain-containing protein n=1 Tax=Stentor coeruleus TaxID=5963 RepID=A0A1R2B8X3_9CILI|nr:hypothetical protein SteCoe_28161 [Stentor coeruleus]